MTFAVVYPRTQIRAVPRHRLTKFANVGTGRVRSRHLRMKSAGGAGSSGNSPAESDQYQRSGWTRDPADAPAVRWGFPLTRVSRKAPRNS